MSSKVISFKCIGAVVDIQFPRDANVPKVYDALVLEESGDSLAEKGLTLRSSTAAGRRYCPYHRHGRRPTACRRGHAEVNQHR